MNLGNIETIYNTNVLYISDLSLFGTVAAYCFGCGHNYNFTFCYCNKFI